MFAHAFFSNFHKDERRVALHFIRFHYSFLIRAAFMLILRGQNQRFETLIQNAVHGSTVYASLEKKTIS